MSRRLFALALVLTVAATTGYTTIIVTQDAEARAYEVAAAEERLAEATREYGAAREAWNLERESAAAALAAAQTVLDDSEGHVLDESPREALASVISNTKTMLAQADTRASLLNVNLKHAYEGVYRTANDGGDAAEIQEVVFAVESLTGEFPDVTVDLDAEIGAVQEAVAAWTAEQERLAAEEAARQAAAAAGRQTHSPSGSASLTENIWTSGGQAEVDACRGSVNWLPATAYTGGDFYAMEHWGCGGSAWKNVGVGSRITVTGTANGLYEVVGTVGGLVYGSTDLGAVPQGYDGYFQTCFGGSNKNMTVFLMTRVG